MSTRIILILLLSDIHYFQIDNTSFKINISSNIHITNDNHMYVLLMILYQLYHF
jgi:hypothetical protein